MKKAWLLRPYPHNTDICRIDEFRKENIIAIGWWELNDLTGKTREEIKSLLEQKPYGLKSVKLGHSYATVDIFVNGIQKDDLVLCPNGGDIYLGMVVGEYRYDSIYANDKYGYPHCREVKWLKHISREELSKQLRRSLKVHRTTADLSKHYQEIYALANDETWDNEDNTIDLIYPLRPDFNITLTIPKDMSKIEAERLSLYFSTLFFKSEE